MSLTYDHIHNVIATECKHREKLSIIDAGCGNGSLITYLRHTLQQSLPSCTVSIQGFDVSDFAPQGTENLARDINIVRSTDPWPFRDHSVDVIVSNQVIEHVSNHDLFFSEIARILKPDGFSVNLFPLKECIYEWHVMAPLAHRIRRPWFINLLVKLGCTNYKIAQIPKTDSDFGERAVEYINKYTNYLSARDLSEVLAKHGLRGRYDYSLQLYLLKMRHLLGRSAVGPYQSSLSLASVLKYLSSITLLARP